MTMLISDNGIAREATAEKEAEIRATLQAAQPQPTSQAVNQERSRRIKAGTTVQVTGYGPVPLQGREEDRINLLGLKSAADTRLAAGDNTTLTKFRDADNVDHMLTPSQIVELWLQGAAWMSDTYDAAWAIKALDPIPADYADDSRWP